MTKRKKIYFYFLNNVTVSLIGGISHELDSFPKIHEIESGYVCTNIYADGFELIELKSLH